MEHPRESRRRRPALVLVDVIQTFEFPQGRALAARAKRIARPLEDLVRRARIAGAPVIWVNDHFADFHADARSIVARARQSAYPELALRLRLHERDYFLMKPRHSGFYQTPLALLLEHLRVTHLVLAGLTTDGCVTFTANDAHVRGYAVTVPRDAVATFSAARSRGALEQLRNVVSAETPLARAVRFGR